MKMDFQNKYITPEIKLASNEQKMFKTEAIFEHHILVWMIYGETKIILANKTHHYKSGDVFLIPRNQLATVIMYANPEPIHQSVAMHLTTDRLRKFYSELSIKIHSKKTSQICNYNNHPLLKSFFASLIPYFEIQNNFPEQIATLKITEAITILRTIDESIDDILANFEEPHKIELSGFMEQNFMFNLPLEKFSYLTGRSLTTFKRDFKKLYDTTPKRWLTKKRLELAYYKLIEKKMNPSDIYLEIGFENLSHFSFAFKKQFGKSPNEMKNNYQ